MSGSTPFSKVTVISARPAELEFEEKYISPSRPVSCCSITWVTLVSSTSAEAPG